MTPAVVLFDGLCNLCDGSVRFAIARDRRERLRFASLDSDAGRALLERFGRANDAASRSSVIVVDGERVFERSDAVLRIARLLGAPWSWLDVARVVPRGLRDAAYRFVAANRYRVFGRTTACRVPTAAERSRFL